MITLTLAANAVNEGNPETSQTIRVSKTFPDTDAEVPTLLFSDSSKSFRGITVTPQRIHLLTQQISPNGFPAGWTIHAYTHGGIEKTSENKVFSESSALRGSLDFINGDFLVGQDSGTIQYNSVQRIVGDDVISLNPFRAWNGITHSAFGFLGIVRSFRGSVPSGHTLRLGDFRADAQNIIEPTTNGFRNIPTYLEAEGDSLYIGNNRFIWFAEITGADEIQYTRNLNITPRGRDISIYRDTLYFDANDAVHTLDIRKYRPITKNTKTTIYPVLANEGDTIDLKQFSPDAERIVFDVGFKKPPFLSINASNGLAISSSAVSETTPVLVRCLAINRIDSHPFSFYLIIRQVSNPVWRKMTPLSMRAGSGINLFDFVDADSISFRSGRTRPQNSTLSNGIFTIGTTGGRVSFTARKGSRSTHTEFDVHVVQQTDPANFSDIFKHRVEIGGIDVTPDVSEFPTVSKSLDDVSLNEYRANDVTLSLKSGRTNNYKYNDDVDGNFWETNGLNAGGFQVPIHISVDSLVDGEFITHLLFSGVITKATANFNNTRVDLRCVDIARELQNTLVQDFGTLEKWDTLRQKTDEATFQGIYTPESSLLPMQTHNAQAWRSDLTKLIMRALALPSEGQPIQDAAHLTPQELLTSGGFLPDNPILNFKAQPRSEDVRYLVNQIALNKKVYNVEIDLPAVSLDTPYILNRGSIPFSVENTRITHL